MKNVIYYMNPQGPNEEVSTIGIRNLVLHTAPTSLFGSLVNTLSPHLGQPVREATCTLADLEEVETIRARGKCRPRLKGEVQKAL